VAMDASRNCSTRTTLWGDEARLGGSGHCKAIEPRLERASNDTVAIDVSSKADHKAHEPFADAGKGERNTHLQSWLSSFACTSVWYLSHLDTESPSFYVWSIYRAWAAMS
jgi:hypothetical protein